MESFIPYFCGLREDIDIDDTVEIEIKTSTLSCMFVEGKQRGLFTKKFIPKNTIIAEVDLKNQCLMNDGLVDLGMILQARTSCQLYDAWQQLYRSYYDLEKIKRVVNVRMVGTSQSSKIYYETIQDIPMNGELIRAYGFTSWIFEVFELLTSHNLGGFAKFVYELKDKVIGDPLESKIQVLIEILHLMIPNLESLDLKQYDQDQA